MNLNHEGHGKHEDKKINVRFYGSLVNFVAIVVIRLRRIS